MSDSIALVPRDHPQPRHGQGGRFTRRPRNRMCHFEQPCGCAHLTRSLAAEWASRGVLVNSISPGYTRTQLVEDLLQTPEGQKVLPTWMGFTPIKRMAEVTDLTGAAVYLASEASDL